MDHRNLLGLLLCAPLASCVIHIDDGGWSWGDSHGPRLRGNGVEASEVRTVAPFQGLTVEGALELTVRVGGEQSVEVFADENLMPYLETRVERGTLELAMDTDYSSHRVIRAVINVPTLEHLSVLGSCDATLEGFSGRRLAIAIEGSGDVRASGSVDRLEVDIDGSGDVRLYELAAREVSVRISGSGDVYTSADAELDVRISGSGDVRYRGAANPSVRIDGSGSVRRDRD